MLALLAACSGGRGEEKDGSTQELTAPEVPAFVRGADVSWVSEMEKDGKTFKTSAGIPADLFKLLADTGLDAVRLRVWVNPAGGWSGRDDCVALAKRAAAAGLAVMVDFHYSDFFADPSTQTVPSAWASAGSDAVQMSVHVKEHTAEVLQALSDAGVYPAWIQIGNETRNGMIWPAGRLWDSSGNILPNGWANFTMLYNAGYNAAKKIFPEAVVMPHMNNAYADNAWWFKSFVDNGGKMDMIALSHYPQTGNSSWSDMNAKAIENIKSLAGAYGVKVMVSETGTKSSDFAEAAKVLTDFMGKASALTECAGVFYWEPEVYGYWKPAVYNTLGWNSYDMGAFLDDGSPSEAFLAFARR